MSSIQAMHTAMDVIIRATRLVIAKNAVMRISHLRKINKTRLPLSPSLLAALSAIPTSIRKLLCTTLFQASKDVIVSLMLIRSNKQAKCADGHPSTNTIMRDKMAALSVLNVLMLSQVAPGAHLRTHA